MKVILIALLLISATYCVELQEQATLQQGGAADLLIEHLNQIKGDIIKESIQHDTLYQAQHASCTTEFEERVRAIQDGEEALIKARTHKATCEGAFHESSADLAQTEANIATITSVLESLKRKRQQDHQSFVETQAELESAIQAVEGAFPIINDFAAGSTGFIEVTRHMGTTFSLFVQTGKGGSLAPILTALLGVSNSFTAAEIDNIKALFTHLLEDLRKSKATSSENELAAQSRYDTTLSSHQQVLATLKETQTTLSAYIVEMSACIAQESAIVDSATAKVASNKAALQSAQGMCQAFETEYSNASASRKAEIALLNKLIEFIKEQAEIFGDYGAESTGVFENYKAQQKSNVQGQVATFLQMRSDKNKVHREKMEKALKSTPAHHIRNNRK